MLENNINYAASIMIVDDNPDNLKLLYQTLTMGGYQNVIIAQDAHSTMLRLQHATPDLILLDIMMPEVDGFELYRLIREHGSMEETPVMFISTLADRESIDRGFELGAVDYITKPFQVAEVIGRVSTHLRLNLLQKSLKSTNEQLFSKNEQLDVLLDRHKCLLNSVAEGIIGIDINHHITFLNPYAQELIGFSAEELQELDVHSLIHHTKLDGNKYSAEDCLILRTIREGGTRFVSDDQFFHKDGTAIRVEYTVSHLQRKFVKEEVIVVFRDITERRRIEQQLEEAAIVFEVSSEGILLTDAKNIIQRVNPAFSEITGYSAEEVIGQTPHVLGSGRHGSAFFADMWYKILRDGYWEGEIWNRRKDGSVYPEWEMITAIQDNQENTVGYVSQFSDITRKKLTEDEIRYRANHDVLTGLASRSLLIERLEQAMKEHRRKNTKLSLMFIDLDKFKQVNDTLGHTSGDLLLQQVAERIKQVVREIDTAARLGGDEFVVMMTDQKNQAPSERVASRLIDSMRKTFELDGQEARIGASIGIAVFPDDGDSVESLFHNADMAMYKAKENGRNQAQFFTESMEEEYLERSQLESELRLALQREELIMYYQPIIDLASGKPVGVESLIRWQHPQRGFVSPAHFIPVAEEIGLIIQIGIWIIKTVCHQLAQWLSQGLDLYASINVSAHQIPEGLPLELLEGIVNDAQLPADRIVLEITESVFVRDVEGVANWLHAVRDKGFRVYLDDFGTGYSSLAYLKQFPVDSVKIDQVFVHEMTHEDRDQSLVRAIVAMSEGLGLSVVAEGIETEEQHTLLRELQASYGQGYLFSKPLPKDQIPDFLANYQVQHDR